MPVYKNNHVVRTSDVAQVIVAFSAGDFPRLLHHLVHPVGLQALGPFVF